MVDAEDLFRKLQLARSLIHRILSENAHRLRQSRIKVGWLHSVIHNQHVARFRVLAQKFTAFGDSPRIFPPQIADVDTEPGAKKAVNYFCRDMSAHRIFAQMDKTAWVPSDPRGQLSELR